LTPDSLFDLVIVPALLGWAILILAPRRWPVMLWVPGLIIPLAMSLVYAVLILAHFASAQGGFDSLDALRQLFTDDWLLLAGWLHYLAFDLMVGAMMAGRMDRAGIIRLVQAPVLILVFLFGPLGVVLALLTEAALRLPQPQLKGAI